MHSRPLLRHREFAAFKIAARLRKQYRHLQRKYLFSVQILMQAVVVAASILEQQRGRLRLPGIMTALQKCLVRGRIS